MTKKRGRGEEEEDKPLDGCVGHALDEHDVATSHEKAATEVEKVDPEKHCGQKRMNRDCQRELIRQGDFAARGNVKNRKAYTALARAQHADCSLRLKRHEGESR